MKNKIFFVTEKQLDKLIFNIEDSHYANAHTKMKIIYKIIMKIKKNEMSDYILLKEGDTIKRGDQFLDNDEWFNCTRFGYKIIKSNEYKDMIYRRLAK